MATILPIDIDTDLVREGLQYALAERLAGKMRVADELIAQLRGGNLVGREEWDSAFAGIAQEVASATPVLDYAGSFYDGETEGRDND